MVAGVDIESKPLGLRERKKQETRRRIRAVAIELFDERGFDHVTIAQIAAQADVSEATVFNYFPTKEDLILLGMADYGKRLIAALRERDPGTSVLTAYRDRLSRPVGFLANPDPAAIAELVRVRRIIASSTSLQAREHLIAVATAMDLADLIAENSTYRINPRFLGIALIGIQQTMTHEIGRLAADGLPGSKIAEIVLPQGLDAVDVLIRGLESGPRAAGHEVRTN